MKHRNILERFSFKVFFIYYFVAIIFAINDLPSLSYMFHFLGAILGFALGE